MVRGLSSRPCGLIGGSQASWGGQFHGQQPIRTCQRCPNKNGYLSPSQKGNIRDPLQGSKKGFWGSSWLSSGCSEKRILPRATDLFTLLSTKNNLWHYHPLKASQWAGVPVNLMHKLPFLFNLILALLAFFPEVFLWFPVAISADAST